MSPEELRELDRRVAEARGYELQLGKWDDIFDGSPRSEWYFLRPDFAEERDADYAWEEVKRYSTDPVASRVLLDEMAADEDLIVAISVGLDGGMAEVELNHVERNRSLFREKLDLAICLAWLAWREGAR